MSPEGWEMMLQVNVSSMALLGLLLLPKVEETTRSHLLNVTSEAHRWLEPKDFPAHSQRLASTNYEPARWDALLRNAKSKPFAMYLSQRLVAMASERMIVLSICLLRSLQV